MTQIKLTIITLQIKITTTITTKRKAINFYWTYLIIIKYIRNYLLIQKNRKELWNLLIKKIPQFQRQKKILKEKAQIII